MPDFWQQNAESWTKMVRENLIASRAVTSPALVNQIQDISPESLLDVGCGEGWLKDALKNIKYFGVDGSKDLIHRAQEKNPASFFCASYEVIQKREWNPPETVDALCFNFSLFEENLLGLMKACKKFLNPQGWIIVQTLNPRGFPVQQWQIEEFQNSPVKIKDQLKWFSRSQEEWVRMFESIDCRLESLQEPEFQGTPASLLMSFRAS